MSENLVSEISVKASALPLDKQREVLDFVEFMLHKTDLSADRQETENERKPFRSVRGILNRKLEHLDEDLAEVRREMWQNFPREEPK